MSPNAHFKRLFSVFMPIKFMRNSPREVRIYLLGKILYEKNWLMGISLLTFQEKYF